MATIEQINEGVAINGPIKDSHRKILTPEATAFLALLHRTFNSTRKELLKRREIRQQELDRGVLPDFLPETKHIRDSDSWKGAPPAPGLVDRRLEITVSGTDQHLPNSFLLTRNRVLPIARWWLTR